MIPLGLKSRPWHPKSVSGKRRMRKSTKMEKRRRKRRRSRRRSPRARRSAPRSGEVKHTDEILIFGGRYRHAQASVSSPLHPHTHIHSTDNDLQLTNTSFFDEEAEASDDDEDDERLKDKDISKEYADEETKAMIAQQNRRREREGGWLENIGRGLSDDKAKDDADVARIARELEERHRSQRRVVRPAAGGRGLGAREGRGVRAGAAMEDDDIGGPSYGAVSQQSLVPSVSDPNLWMFSVMPKKETELVYQIMNKCVAYAKRGTPLGITSVVTAQTKGKIYVESYSEPAVMEAVQGVRGVLVGTMVKVPLSDMTTVMHVVPKKVPGEYSDISLLSLKRILFRPHQ